MEKCKTINSMHSLARFMVSPIGSREHHTWSNSIERMEFKSIWKHLFWWTILGDGNRTKSRVGIGLWMSNEGRHRPLKNKPKWIASKWTIDFNECSRRPDRHQSWQPLEHAFPILLRTKTFGKRSVFAHSFWRQPKVIEKLRAKHNISRLLVTVKENKELSNKTQKMKNNEVRVCRWLGLKEKVVQKQLNSNYEMASAPGQTAQRTCITERRRPVTINLECVLTRVLHNQPIGHNCHRSNFWFFNLPTWVNRKLIDERWYSIIHDHVLGPPTHTRNDCGRTKRASITVRVIIQRRPSWTTMIVACVIHPLRMSALVNNSAEHCQCWLLVNRFSVSLRSAWWLFAHSCD